MQDANGPDASQQTTAALPTQPGCYVQASPDAAWQPTACGIAPAVPDIPATGSSSGGSAEDVGNGNDEVASSASTIIGSTVGSFPAISGLTGESGAPGPAFPGSHCLSGDVSNCYSLQLNTQTFSCNTSYTNSITTTCWEQFVSSNTGQLYIQFWLLGYCTSSGGSSCNDSPPFSSTNPAPSFSCPGSAPPGGGGWTQSGGSCYGNSASVSPPSTTATSLGKLSLSGYANYLGSGNDVIKLCISGGSCYSVTLADNVLDLYQNWSQSEFNVFGDASGSQAVFNAGTSIQVSTALTDQSGNPIAPSCVNNGSTGETNNLFLGPCSASSSGITFTEASQAFSLSAASSDVTVLAGQTATFSVGLTLTQGTAAPVALSIASGLPSGATAAFTPGSVTPTGSSTLTISTPPSVTLGDYTLTIQAQFGVLVQTTTVNLHIYDFTVGLSPGDRTVLSGTTTSYHVTLTLAAGSSTTGVPAIGLADSGLPGDAASSFGSSSVTLTPGGSSTTLTVTTAGPPSGSLGDFSFSVTGTDPSASGGSRSDTANLHIYDFTVGITPSDQTIIRGASAVYALTLTLVPGSTSTGVPAIGLAVSGLPSDATSSFSASSITPTLGGCTVCQTITVTTKGPPTGSLGDYTFKVTGTDPNPSGGSRSGSANLHIFDYTVALSPPAETLSQGTSTTMTVSVGLVPGSSTVGLPSVSLSLTGLPSGVTETGFPSSLSIGGSQAFTVQTSTVGSYVSCPQVSNKGGQNLKGANLQSCNLSGYNLSGDNLMNANLQGADLQNANLAGANLMNANLASAYTAGTDFQGANMKGVDISASVPLGDLHPDSHRCGGGCPAQWHFDADRVRRPVVGGQLPRDKPHGREPHGRPSGGHELPGFQPHGRQPPGRGFHERELPGRKHDEHKPLQRQLQLRDVPGGEPHGQQHVKQQFQLRQLHRCQHARDQHHRR